MTAAIATTAVDTGLTMLGKVADTVTTLTKLGASLEAQHVAERSISYLYGYFLVKCETMTRVHSLWLRLGFIVGDKTNGGKRFAQEFRLAELSEVSNFADEMQDSQIINTLYEYLNNVWFDLVGREVLPHPHIKPNEVNDDFKEVEHLLNEAVLQPMIIYLYNYKPPTTPPKAPSDSQPQSAPQPFSPKGPGPKAPPKGGSSVVSGTNGSPPTDGSTANNGTPSSAVSNLSNGNTDPATSNGTPAPGSTSNGNGNVSQLQQPQQFQQQQQVQRTIFFRPTALLQNEVSFSTTRFRHGVNINQ